MGRGGGGGPANRACGTAEQGSSRLFDASSPLRGPERCRRPKRPPACPLAGRTCRESDGGDLGRLDQHRPSDGRELRTGVRRAAGAIPSPAHRSARFHVKHRHPHGAQRRAALSIGWVTSTGHHRSHNDERSSVSREASGRSVGFTGLIRRHRHRGATGDGAGAARRVLTGIRQGTSISTREVIAQPSPAIAATPSSPRRTHPHLPPCGVIMRHRSDAGRQSHDRTTEHGHRSPVLTSGIRGIAPSGHAPSDRRPDALGRTADRAATLRVWASAERFDHFTRDGRSVVRRGAGGDVTPTLLSPHSAATWGSPDSRFQHGAFLLGTRVLRSASPSAAIPNTRLPGLGKTSCQPGTRDEFAIGPRRFT